MDTIDSSGPSGPEKGGINGKRILYCSGRKRRDRFFDRSGVYAGEKGSATDDNDRELYGGGRMCVLENKMLY